MYTVPLTSPCENRQWHKEVADNINRENPKCATVVQTRAGFYVAITPEYLEGCKVYVAEHCRIKKSKKH